MIAADFDHRIGKLLGVLKLSRNHALCASCILLSGCAVPAIIEYDGPLTRPSVDKLVQELKTGKKYQLRIRSLGGDLESSLRLAEAVRESGSAVIVRDYCGSGCTLSFIAASRRSMEPGAILLFHWNAYSHSKLYSERLGAQSAESVAYAEFARRERQIYQAGNILEDLILDSPRLVQMTCLSVVSVEGRREPKGNATHGYVTFTKEIFEHYGFPIRQLEGAVTTHDGMVQKLKSHPEWNFQVALVSMVSTVPLILPRDCP
jgi:hypothetical protein